MAFQGYAGEGAPEIGRAAGEKIGGRRWGGVTGAIGSGIGQWIKSGLTKPGPTGAQAGQQSLDYMNAAYPGTNPWERLGTSGQGAPLMIADRQQKSQQRIARGQVAAQTSISAKVVSKDLEVAKIHGKAVAVNNAGTIGIANIKPMGDYITGEDTARSGVSGVSTQRVSALAQEMDAWTRNNLAILKETQVAAEIGRGAGDPATAALQAMAAQAFKLGMSQSEIIKTMEKHFNKLRVGGVAVGVLTGLSKMLRGFVGRLKIGR